jgi:ubiquinone/menaquinone biosynthesis C-methylase UbiE
MNKIELNQINEFTRQSYNLVAKKYHKLFKDEMNQKKYDRKLLDDFSKYFSLDSKIYDMGCGPSGHIGRYLYDKGLKVIGIDISEKCIDIATNYNPGMQFQKMDMIHLEMQDQSIDGIISFYSIIHTPKNYINLIFQEFKRVLKQGGKLLVTAKEGEDEGFIENFLECKTSIYFTHFKKQEIEKYFLVNGFELLFLERRIPYEEEIAVYRIYGIGEKV